MISAYELIGQMKSKINSDMKYSQPFEAIRAYEKDSLPVPVDKIYICLSPEKVTAGYELVSEKSVKKHSFHIRVNCYVPFNNKGYIAGSLAEKVMSFLNESFLQNFVSYTVGATSYDSSVRAYKAESVIEFSFIEE